MPKFRKKPVVIEALQFNGNNTLEIESFVGKELHSETLTSMPPIHCIIIPTLEGNHQARPGDYIIKGVHGEFYPCKPDIFQKTYETVDGHPID